MQAPCLSLSCELSAATCRVSSGLGRVERLLEATTEKHQQSNVLGLFFFLIFVLCCFVSSRHHYTKLFYPKHKTNPKKSHIMCKETVAYK